AYRDEHLALAWAAQAAGNLILAGAFSNPADGAVFHFRGDTPAAAEAFPASDPYVKNGLVTRWRVREWITAVGDAAATPVRPQRQTLSADSFRLFHNARCSKSRAACALLAERGISVELVDYLTTPPTKSELLELLKKLGMVPSELVRRGEAIFKEHYAHQTLTEDQWLEALATHAILIERPILVQGEKAVIGRPPERILELV
ncbi:MAG: arsenate reductase (glutaredoxin), partial [Holophaga sp.]|nr:arsenate reductase (glutaredoxin) [Holophaga sp.]